MKTFCKSVEEHAMEITNFETEKMIPLTDEGSKSYERQNICYICRKKLKKKMKSLKDCHYTGKCRGAAHHISNLR